MLNVTTRHAIHQDHAKGMDTTALRENFLADGMFKEGEINLIYTHYDRMIVGAGAHRGCVRSGLPAVADQRDEI